jgi:hypothetical protein
MKTSALDHRTANERRKFGKSLRKSMPRSAHAHWPAPLERPNPVDLIEVQNEA